MDSHKRYSHMTVPDAQGRVLKAGNVPNTTDAVGAFIAPYREGGRAAVEATRNWTVIYALPEAELQDAQLAHPLKVRATAEARIKTARIPSSNAMYRTFGSPLYCLYGPLRSSLAPLFVAQRSKGASQRRPDSS